MHSYMWRVNLFLNVMDVHLMVLSIESTKISENDFATIIVYYHRFPRRH